MYRKKLIGELSPEEWQALKEISREITLGEGEILFEEGEPEDYIYLVMKGKVSIGRLEDNHKWVNFGTWGEVDLSNAPGAEDLENSVWIDRITLGKGEVAGEPGMTMLRHHRLSARCEGECDLMQLNADEVESLKKDHSHLYKTLMECMASEIEALEA